MLLHSGQLNVGASFPGSRRISLHYLSWRRRRRFKALLPLDTPALQSVTSAQETLVPRECAVHRYPRPGVCEAVTRLPACFVTRVAGSHCCPVLRR